MNPEEKEFTPVVADAKQLVDAYPGIFEKINIDNQEIYIEKPNPNKEETFMSETRLFLLPSGMVSVSTKDLDFLWSVNENDKNFLEELNISIEAVNRKRINNDNPHLFQITYISGIEYGLTYAFYKDPMSCDWIMNELDQKELARKGLPPRR